MLNIQGYIDLLNDRSYKIDALIFKQRQVYYGMSLHIDGVYPYFQTMSNPLLGWVSHNLVNVYPNCFGGLEYQYLFDTYLFSRHPREPELIRQWRLSQYKPFTQAPFLQVIQIITGALFQDSGYQLVIDDKEDAEYIWHNNFDGKDLVGYLSANFQNIAEDPNGVFVTIPGEPAYATTTKRIEPKIYFIHSKFIRWHNKNEIVFEYEGIHWAVNEMGYFRFIEREGKVEMHPDDVAYGGYYAHFLGKYPVVVAGGQWNSQGYYDSWLNAAKPIADEYVGAKSAEQLVNKEASHPFIVATSDNCPDCSGVGKVQFCTLCKSLECDCEQPNANLSSMNCSTCGGSGDISRNPGQWQIVPYAEMDRDAIKIVSPAVDINKFHKENNESIFEQIRKALHLYEIDEAQSGTAKEKDMEARYQFLSRINNDSYDRILPEWIETIIGLRNVTVSNGSIAPGHGGYTIIKPTQFNMKTEGDLLTEFDAAQKAQMPEVLLQAKMRDYGDKAYGGDRILQKKLEFICQDDIFAVTTPANISIEVLNNAGDNRAWQYHKQLPILLDTVVRLKGDDWFLMAEYQAIKDQVQPLFDAIKPVIPTIQPPTNERVLV